jgi:putative tryptophan/tyrosine transport system substrate-binding protein
MRRRELILLLGGTASAWPLSAPPQQERVPIIGLLGAAFAEDPAVGLNLQAFRRGLKETDFVEGENVAIEYRWAHRDYDRLPALAAELLARNVDVIVNEGGTPSALAAKTASSTIPIVFHAGDAIADGLVGNLARPGGNLTGVSLFAPESLSKQFQLLSELVPQAKLIAQLTTGTRPFVAAALGGVEAAAHAKGMQFQLITAPTDRDIEIGYARLGEQRALAIVSADATRADQLVALAARHRVPAIYNQRVFPVAGGLVSYGVSLPAVYAIKGNYTGKILKGAKPGELPVQQPDKFELAINLNTAKALGVTMPPTLLAGADEVIE